MDNKAEDQKTINKPVEEEEKKTKKKTSFFVQIITGLLTGTMVGLFFGGYCSCLRFIGNAFIGLLQMTVLPYITLSLIFSIGKLTRKEAKILAVKGIYLLLALWIIGALAVFFMSFALPPWESGSFFSDSFLQEPQKTDMVKLYIPSNPFYSLTYNLVPAVVLFSIGTGIALMELDKKSKFLEQLEVLTEALKKLNNFVVKLTPLGVFFIAADLAGTMEFKQLELVQVYLVILTVGTIMLVFGILPLLMTSLTSLKYKDILHSSKDALIMSFATGSVFVALPMIVDSTKELSVMNQVDLEKDKAEKSTKLIVPLAFPFPDLGRIWALIFIPFASWFYGNNLSLLQYPRFLSVGILSAFGSLNNAVPYLLRLMKIPSDIFNLYTAFGFYTTRLNKGIKAMFLITFTILLISWISGTIKFRWVNILKFIGGSAITILIVVILLKGLFSWTFTKQHSKEKLLVDRRLIGPKMESTLLKESSPNPVKKKPGETIMERAKRRGILRVGVDLDELPFSYMNSEGNLVGFDVDMAHQLASDLKLKLEFVPIERGMIVKQLKEDHFDIVMAGIQGTIYRASMLQVPSPYLDATLALVVHDSQRMNLSHLSDIRNKSGLTFAVVKGGFFAEKASEYFPEAKFIEIESEKEYFIKKGEGFDALLTSAETGFAWTLIYPQFAVTNPFEGQIRVPLFYLFNKDPDFKDFIETWQDVNQKDGTMKIYYNYWIMGKEYKKKKKRWCIVRDVLHWCK